MAESYHRQLEVAIHAAQIAGGMLRAEFHRSGGPRGEGGHADMDDIAEAEIFRQVSGAFPEYGYRGEELGFKGPPRDAGRHTWVVDPNDGTSDFLRGFRGSSVAIALLRRGVPVLGVVYAYCSPDDGGDLITWAEGCGSLRRNGVAVVRAWPARVTEASTILVSTYADLKAQANAYAVAPMRFRGTPSIAHRLALVAAGDADATVSLNAPNSWDYAAGHALLIGSGGLLTDARGRSVTYRDDGFSDAGQIVYAGPELLVLDLIDRDWHEVTRTPKEKELPFVKPLRGRAVEQAERLSRAQGCILAQMAGDSLGSLVEGEPAEEIARRYPQGLSRLETGGVWGTIAGQPTDDSEMALALARSIVAAERYDRTAAEHAYLAWFHSASFGVGATTSAALSGNPDATSQANGALMRVSPVGVALPPDAAYFAGFEDAGITHPNRICREASALYAAAVSYAIRSGENNEAAYEWSRHYAVERETSEALRSALDAARHAPPAQYSGQQGWVLIAFQNAFYQLLHAETLESGVVDTVMRGGDTDTNAAIAGGLLGAVHGFRRVPHQWVDRVLSCRPLAGLPGVQRPRPKECWPIDAFYLAERLLMVGG